MKAKSITSIREILQHRVTDAAIGYKARKYNMEEKYKTEWIDKEMTEEERKAFYADKEALTEAIELLEDFENHQWQ